ARRRQEYAGPLCRARLLPVVGAQTANERSRGLQLAGEVMRCLFTGKGMLTYSPSIVAASVKVLEESATPDMQVTFAPGSFKGGQIGELEETPSLSAVAWQMRPPSRGLCRGQIEPRRRSTRAICRRKPTGAPSSAGCDWPGGCSSRLR
ncbi:MAG: hypothetical protein WA633_25700, partial [Stellaceae bacterium]